MITTVGKGLWARSLGDANNGFTGTAASFSTTTLKASGSPGWTVNAYAGQDVYVGAVVGTILSNTSEVLTVARWETPGKRGEKEAAAEPEGTPPFSIASGATPATWMAISADTAEPKASNTTLKGEIKTSEGGLIRALATFTYLGENKYKVEAIFKSNSHDELPITIAKIGIFNAAKEGIMLFESLLTSTAEIKVEGDQVSISDTVSGS